MVEVFMLSGSVTVSKPNLDPLDQLQFTTSTILRQILNLNCRTKILVRAPSRTKQKNRSKKNAMFTSAMDDPYLEWFGSLLRYQVDTIVKQAKTISTSLRNVFQNFFRMPSLNLKFRIIRDSIIGSVMEGKSGKSHIELINNMNSDISKIINNADNGVPKIWFWDTSIPVDIKNIKDCDTLYDHDPLTISLSETISFWSKSALRLDYMSKIIGNKQSGNLGRNNKWRDHFNLRHINKNFKTAFSKNNTSYATEREKENPTSTKSDRAASSAETYYDGFASAYTLPDLHCDDFHHPGMLTEQFEVTQMLNLMCNQHLDSGPDMCCTNG